LSRRLGDDPLTRAKAKRAKAAEGPTLAAPDSGGPQQGTAQVEIQTAPRASYNDVFFQRRGEGSAPPRATAATPGATEVAEISEISEIPEIREVATASGNRSAFDVIEAARDTQVAPAQTVSMIEEVAPKSNVEVLGAISTEGASPELKGEPANLPASSQAPASGAEPKPEPQKSGGFFKRLFGKFK
jgi:hypothetical protein